MHNSFFGVVAIFLIAGQHSEAQSFNKTQLTISPEPNIYANLEWVDLDGDKDPDIVELYSNSNDASQSFVKIYQNVDEIFTEVPNAFTGMDPRNYDFKDFDSDGDVDMLFLDFEAIKIAVNNGSFSFTIQNTTIQNPGNWRTEIHWQDLDSDLDLDIVFESFIYTNVDGAYSPALYRMPFATRNRSWADVNNDGYLDMIAAKGQTHGVDPLFLFINQGSALFKESAQLSPEYLDLGQAQWLDADADDDLDLFVTEAGDHCTLFRNKFSESGEATFEKTFSFRRLINPQVDAGDVNLDGLPDLVISGQGFPGFETYLYLNSSGAGQIDFTETNLQINPYLISNFDLVDIDGDLDLDLFIMGWEDGWYLVRAQDAYKIAPGNTRALPVVPSGLASVVEKNVTLSWDHDDNEGSVYFALEVKRNGLPYRSALSLPTGELLTPDYLNHQTAQNIILRNLPAGNYEWKVQAYDHAHRVSGFSGTNSFTIMDSPIAISLNVLAYNKVMINWQFTGTATEFGIFRRSSNGPLTEIGSVSGGANSFIDAAVPPNEHVEYVVKAVSNGSYSAPSLSVSYYSSQFEEEPFDLAGPNIITATGVSADFDGDQDYDLGFVGRIDLSSGSSIELVNDGLAQYTQTSFLPSNEEMEESIIVRDMDNDGDIDLCGIVGGAGVGYKVAMYKNNGNTFTKSFETSTYPAIRQIASEDMNYDGRPDLMIKRSVGNYQNLSTYELLYQTPTGGGFTDKFVFLPEMNNTDDLGDFYLADVNNDGFTDVIFGGTQSVKATLFVNIKGYTFKETPFSFPLLTDAVFFDFNGDGKMDVLQRGFQVLNIYNGLGNLEFSAPKEISIAGVGENNSVQVKIADMDFNGWPDLFINDRHNTLLLYNKGDGNFAMADYQFASDWDTQIFLTDMEGDGDLDLVKQGNDHAHHGVNYYYKNRSLSSPGENAAPTAPSSLQAVRTKNTTTLSWASSTDDTTPAQLISYHVQIKDSNGKIWIHPETNASGNFRRRLAFGNAGFRTTYTINNLPAGQYTAYIQAVDATFKLSPLSSALSFQITAGPTGLAAERILLNKIKLTWADGPFVGTKTIVERKSLVSDFEIVAELPANSTEYIDANLSYDNLYTYQVYEVVGGIPSAGSNQANWNTTILVLQQSTITNVSGSLDVGEYTGDGKMDVAIHGGRIYNSSIPDFTNALLEKTSNGWLQQNIGSTAPHSGTSNFYDIDGDHQLDLYQHGYFYGDNKYHTQVFLNNGDKTFTETTNAFTNNYFTITETWDYDRDNDLDFYVRKPDVGTSLLKNNGNGVFNEAEDIGSCCHDSLVPGDFDNDGDEDLVYFDKSSNQFTLSLNKDGAMQFNAVIAASGGLMQKLDYNGDGWPDLLFISTDNSNVKSKLYKNIGPDESGVIQFKIIKDDLPAGDAVVNSADYDHDGDLDFFFTGRPCVMYNNEGNDVFNKNEIRELSATTNRTKWIDFDSDGDLDLFIMGYLMVDFMEGVDQPFAYVLNNQLIVNGKGIPNQPPAAPVNLNTHQDTSGMHLMWMDPPDDHTPQGALTHDVIIYRNGKEIVKGPLHPLTGMRYKLQEGRTAETLLVDSLPYGDYLWRVQAIDQTFSGSSLSAAGFFTFMPQAPFMKDTVIYKCDRTITLTAKGASIEWYSDEGLTNKVGSGTYSPQATQTVYVTQTIEGMRGVARPVQITIHERPPMPVAGANPYLYCENAEGTSAYIQASGVEVKWYKDVDKKISAGTGNQIQIKLTEQTYYTTQTISQCESLPAAVVIKPLVIDSQIYFEDDRVYTSEQNGSAYQWFRNNLPVPNSNSYFLDVPNHGDVYNVVIQKGACSEVSEPMVITAIEESATDGLRVFPNPAIDNFTIESTRTKKGVLKIYDVAGRAVYETSLSETSPTLLIPSATWSNGVYFITVTYEHHTVSRKVVIK